MENTLLSIKLVAFTLESGKLKVYSTGDKLPAGPLKKDKSLDDSAEIIFRENIKLPLKNIYFEQLYTFSHQKHSEITVVYYFLVPEHKISSNKKNWFAVTNIKLNVNDKEIIRYAVQRLQWKIEYTNAVYSLLPPEFTFSKLQSAYEAILGKVLDKRNFRKKIAALNLLKSTGHKKREGRSRPAEMFSFRKRELTFVKILQPSR